MNRTKHLLPTIFLTLALSLDSSSQTFVKNPSFESNYNETWPHYGGIDEWTGGSGVNDASGPFHNGGTAIPDQTRAAFIQGPDKTFSQEISGLVAGKKYWIQFAYDARACCGGTIDLATKFADKPLDNIVNVKPASAPAAYYTRSVEFTAEAETGVLAFVTAGSGDATVLIDAVSIVQRDAGNVVLMNPSFEAGGDVPEPGELTVLTGWKLTGTVGVSGADNGTVPDQAHVAFLSGASAISQRASSLLVGKPYSLVLAYNARTGTTPRLQVKAGDKVLFEENVSPAGAANPFRSKTVTFTAEAVIADITISQTGTGVLLVDDVRLLGETGRELDPLRLAPATAEIGVGERIDVVVTVPAELLATKSVDIVLESSGANVLRFPAASGVAVPRTVLHFDQGGPTAKTVQVQSFGRGSAIVQVVEAGGLKVANQPAVTVVASAVKNPSFESSPVPGGVGYGAIMGWSGGSGLNSPPGPFSDNGIVPDRKQVGFIQGSGTLSQEVRGLVPGKNYWLQFHYNGRTGTKMDLAVKIGGKQAASIASITPVGEGAPYHFSHSEFVAESATALLEFTTTPTGDSTLLLDGINIVQRDAGQVVVQNPSFEASGSVFPFPGYFDAVAGWTVGGGGRGVNIDGAGPFTDNGRSGDQDLVLFMQGNGSFVSQTLAGLTAGRKYIVAFLVNGRSCCGPEENAYVVSFDDTPLIEETFMPVGGANRFLARQAVFAAAGTEGVLKFQGATPAGDHTILVDNVVVIPETGTAPFIIGQPSSIAVASGQAATFSIAAVGSGTLSYQWKKDGQNLSGQTTDTLSLENITPAMAGEYAIEAKNPSGAVTSNKAMLTVLEAVPGVFDTGTDASRVLLADGGTDSHYTLAQNPDAPVSSKALVQDSSKWPIAAGPWLANSELSKWIGPRADPGTESPLTGPASGEYVYRLSLDLTGFEPATVVLSGGWASDNSAELIVNGLQTGIRQAGFAGLAQFTLRNVFTPGVNQVDFKVNNGDATGGPTGLRVEGLTALGAKSGGGSGEGGGPTLAVALQAGDVKISWPVTATGFLLESAPAIRGSWTAVATPAVITGATQTVTVSAAGSAQFYRLKK